MIILVCLLFNFDCGEEQQERKEEEPNDTGVYRNRTEGKRPCLNTPLMRRGAPNSAFDANLLEREGKQENNEPSGGLL